MIVEKLTVERAQKFLEEQGYRVLPKDRFVLLRTSARIARDELECIEKSIGLEEYIKRTAVHQLAAEVIDKADEVLIETTNKHDPYTLYHQFDLTLCFVKPNRWGPGPVFVKREAAKGDEDLMSDPPTFKGYSNSGFPHG